MQQLKLAALGRLTASIAHEIRNPLAAVNNANQLLEESPHLTAEDRRFTSIITTHVARVNTIIENVLQLGRRGRLRPEVLDLGAWLRDTVDAFRREHYLQPAPVELELPDQPVRVRVDPTHLQQVLWNLLENALKHGVANSEAGRVTVRCAGAPGGGAWLEVADDGPGIPAEVAEHVFEPFYTGSARGTGLGLFIARELAAANRASLTHRTAETPGATFRITFPDPDLWMS
jgi:two-component system sensor histidine kinase PilS (NtrC family)